MEDLHVALKDLQLSLQTLLKKYNYLKKENEQLKKSNEALNKMLAEKEKLINVAEEKIATTNINTIFDPKEKQLLQLKIDAYLKDIEKCLALLNA
jgi:hypothetical protein